LVTQVTQWHRQIKERFIANRLPRVATIVLGQKSLFIAPNYRGLAIICLVIVLWLAAITYQNNALLICSAFLLSVLLVAIGHSYRNMAGIRVRPLQARSVHAGQDILIPIALSRSGTASNAVHLSWRDVPNSGSWLAEVTSDDCIANLSYTTQRRGHFLPPRLIVESDYPLGIIRCWTYLSLDVHAIVWPELLHTPLKASAGMGGSDSQLMGREGVDDFDGLREYQRGESQARIDWKSFAAQKGMQTKVFRELIGQDVWLRLEDAPGLTLELKISQLAARAVELSKAKIPFGLDLADTRVEIKHSERHLTQVLNALALYGGSDVR